MQKQNGFTLVELAIVLMIIGLLIGGILRGQELMDNSRVTSLTQQIKSYSAAMTSFRDAYNALPGDMALAMQRIPNCNAGNNCANGNGDGLVGISTATPWSSGITNLVASENTQFWKHLALAHLISGVDPSTNTIEWGRSNPVSRFNAGFFVSYSNFDATSTGYPGGGLVGHNLLLRRNVDGAWSCGAAISCAISPQRAAQIDRKMDDGVALTGDVISVSGGWGSGCGLPANGPNGYAENKTDLNCDMMFKL